ncbi:hypothetical protein OH76DRAFT_1416827 [Lentinus brumalis]|uniref:Uncharacterized protein n=1 Tax=Lentinus brumalis TaxID=2498619 RepID=A0A371DIC4_9APHY|nr:hypothetical protein OH76DRAFT_1416827 [Polyporus brumalis]
MSFVRHALLSFRPRALLPDLSQVFSMADTSIYSWISNRYSSGDPGLAAPRSQGPWETDQCWWFVEEELPISPGAFGIPSHYLVLVSLQAILTVLSTSMAGNSTTPRLWRDLTVIEKPDYLKQQHRTVNDCKRIATDIADDIGATIMDYAQSGACTDLSLWPSAINQVDFIGQMTTFINQSNDLDPETTLYAVFFGIKTRKIRRLADAPTNARSFLVTDVYGRGTHTAAGDAFVQTVFPGLHDLHLGINSTGQGEDPRLQVAFAEHREAESAGPRLQVVIARLRECDVQLQVFGPTTGRVDAAIEVVQPRVYRLDECIARGCMSA